MVPDKDSLVVQDGPTNVARVGPWDLTDPDIAKCRVRDMLSDNGMLKYFKVPFK